MGRVKEYYIREINSHDERIDEEYFYYRKPKTFTLKNLIKKFNQIFRKNENRVLR